MIKKEKLKSLESSKKRRVTDKKRSMPSELKEHLNRVKGMLEQGKSFNKRRKPGSFKILMPRDKSNFLKKRIFWPLKLRKKEMNS